ncbi:MAG: carboxymuconolactone decarboxylase family protein [Chloroflexi bacterium]|nr:carboxymuconolactone decarboxylase family protein [Chloroflexota bacterium]MCI0782357.1 carboxymuconolactone decarboxylase family protein [Chloroflexota bacterium]MCI0786010.1 carboxymuconolactone decarboxylase family protein [Chloroflexota bacterium]MCI0793303.1 carboxymuconolactone decarboxylase family protein [Chloroflexota bacterium]MCI0797800.1 carboxymuconolactone decarboxylase family protein [Chloroflexota bacterium]
MARLPAPTRESVPEKYRDLFDEVVKERGGIPTGGPGSVTLNSPEVAKRTNHLSAYLRQGSGLPAKIQELAMLTTARELDCQYIWNAHAAAGRQAGLSDALVDAMRDKKDLPNIPEDEAAVINYGREFYRTHRVSDATFQAALQQFGAHGLTNLTNLMGYYALLAFNANCFQIDLPAERSEPTLPI